MNHQCAATEESVAHRDGELRRGASSEAGSDSRPGRRGGGLWPETLSDGPQRAGRGVLQPGRLVVGVVPTGGRR